MTQEDSKSKSLFDEIQEAKDSKPASGCQIAKVLEELDATDRATLISALNDISVKGTTLAKILKGRGFSVSDIGVRRHRRGDCACERN